LLVFSQAENVAKSLISMLRSTILVSFLALVGSAISFLNQLVLARFFGAGMGMDAYLIAISLPLTLVGLFSGVLGYQLVPALQRVEVRTGSSNGLLRSLECGLGGSTAVLSIFSLLLTGTLIVLLTRDKTGTDHALATEVARIAWLWLPFAVLSAVYTAKLYVQKRFLIATALQSFPIIGTLVGCLLAHKYLGVCALAWGQLVGYLVMTLCLRISLRLAPADPDWGELRRLLKEVPLALMALLVFVVYPFSDAIWGSRIGPAAVSYLGYAQRLLVGFSGLAVVGATTVLFPRLASKAAQGEHHSMRRDLGLSLRVMLVCMAPAAVLFGVLVLPALQVLFQRGAFTLADARSLAKLLPFMLVGMTAMSCMGLVFKALFARGDIRAAAVISIVGATAYFALSWLFSTAFGLVGIGVAYALSWWLALGLSLRHLWQGKLGAVAIRSNLQFALCLAVGAALTAAIGWFGTKFLPPENSMDNFRRLLVLAATAFSGMGTYLVIGNGPLAIPEMRLLKQQLFALAKRT
jgi:putative peptidoglycan lipid II flippase